MNAVFDFALAALKALPSLISAGQDALALVSHARAQIAQMQAEGRGPTDTEWAALDDTINGLMAQLKD